MNVQELLGTCESIKESLEPAQLARYAERVELLSPRSMFTYIQRYNYMKL